MSEDVGEDAGDEAAATETGGRRKLFVIIGAAAVVVLLAGGGAGLYFAGLLDGILPKKATKTAVIELGPPVTHQLPQIKADLKTGLCRSALIRTTIVVQLAATDLTRLQSSELRVIDAIRAYLRDQERQDLVGRQGTDKLRTDLTRVINNTITPAAIHSMLFKELVLQ